MRALFFLLCLLNMTFLLWQFHAGRFNPPVTQPKQSVNILTVEEYLRARRGARIAALYADQLSSWQQAEVAQIMSHLRGPQWQYQVAPKQVQVKKTAKPVDDVKVSAVDKPVVPVVIRKCFEAGPFADEASAKRWLQQKSLNSKQIVTKDTVVSSDYQVYFPAAKSPEQSRINKLMLNAKGVQDIWLIPSGDIKGAYSLGVFNEKPRAALFKKQLAERGIQAEIMQREKTQSHWFARVMLDKTTLKQFESPGTKLVACASN